MATPRRKLAWLLLLSGTGYVASFFVQILISCHFGTSLALDAYWVAFTVLNLFAFYAHPVREALVPGFYRRISRSKDAANAYFTQALALTVALAVAATFAMLEWPDVWAEMATSAQSAPALRFQATKMMVLLAPALLLFVLSEVLNALFASFDRVLLQQSVRLLGTMVNLACLVALADRFGVAAIALGFLLGQMTMAGLQIFLLFKLGLRLRWSRAFELDKPFYKVVGAFVFAAGCSQAYAVYEKNAMTLFGAGWVSAMQYAVTLVNVLIMVFATSVVNLLWPHLLNAATTGNSDAVRKAVGRAASVLLVVLVPTTLLCYLEAPSVIRALFGRGSFGVESLAQTSLALRATIFAAIPIALTTLFVRALASLRQARPLTWIGIAIAGSGAGMLTLAQVTGDIRLLLLHWIVGNTVGVVVAGWLFAKILAVPVEDLGSGAIWVLRLALVSAGAYWLWPYVSATLPSDLNLFLRLALGSSLFFGLFWGICAVVGLLPWSRGCFLAWRRPWVN